MPLSRCTGALALIAILLLCAPAMAGEISLAEQINDAVKRFEDTAAGAFKPVESNLDRWRETKRRTALAEMFGLMQKAATDDKPYLAYNILSINPTHKAVRAFYTTANLPVPFTDKGEHVEGVKMPATKNQELITKVAELSYPPFDVVREAINPKSATVSSYWHTQESALKKLKAEIADVVKGNPAAADIAYPMLAFYRPELPEVKQYYAGKGKPIPRQRIWFPLVDRYLLDHELAGVDCLLFKPDAGAAPSGAGKGASATLGGTAMWKFPENLRNCRLEGLLTAPAGGGASFAITDERHHGVELRLAGKQLLSLTALAEGGKTALGDFPSEADLSALPTPLQLEVRGKKLALRVGGVQIGTAELPSEYAYNQISVTGSGLVAAQLRVRFLSDVAQLGDDGAVAAKPAKPVEPADEPWRAERKGQLQKPVSFAFNDTSVDEVVSILSQISGVKFSLDNKGELLKNLPVTLAGSDMKLQSALDWLQKVTDLEAVPTAMGFTLTWNK